jgi:hypothetical protein
MHVGDMAEKKVKKEKELHACMETCRHRYALVYAVNFSHHAWMRACIMSQGRASFIHMCMFDQLQSVLRLDTK